VSPVEISVGIVGNKLDVTRVLADRFVELLELPVGVREIEYRIRLRTAFVEFDLTLVVVIGALLRKDTRSGKEQKKDHNAFHADNSKPKSIREARKKAEILARKR
jgi:hypothetical protein